MPSFVLHTEADRYHALRAVERAPLGQQVDVKRAKRTTEQNKHLHAMLADLSKQLPWENVYRDIEWWKRRAVLQWLLDVKEQPDLIGALGSDDFAILLPHTSDLNTRQFASLVEWLESFGVQHGVKFREMEEPPPPEGPVG